MPNTSKYTIRTSKQVNKFLARHHEVAKRFIKKLEIMTGDPFDARLDIVPLVGEEDTFRLRIGEYRFLYTIDGDEITIYFYKAHSRGSIYKK